jgi:hypothetical protein
MLVSCSSFKTAKGKGESCLLSATVKPESGTREVEHQPGRCEERHDAAARPAALDVEPKERRHERQRREQVALLVAGRAAGRVDRGLDEEEERAEDDEHAEGALDAEAGRRSA